MTSDDAEELRVLRRRAADLEERLDRLGDLLDRDCRVVLAETVSDGSYPTAAGVVYALRPVDLTGPEKEGGTPTKSVGSDTFYATHLGTTAPPVGTEVVAVLVPYRWVFTY